MIQSRSREQIVGLLAIAPALFLILALTLYPVAYSIWLSLLEKHSFFPQERFVGLENFFYLWKDEEFWTSLWLGTVYSVWTILFQIILGVAAALILNESFVGRGLVRAIVLFPYMIPTIVAVRRFVTWSTGRSPVFISPGAMMTYRSRTFPLLGSSRAF